MSKRLQLVLLVALVMTGCHPKPPIPPPPKMHFVAMHWDDVQGLNYIVLRGPNVDALAPYWSTTQTQFIDRNVVAGETYFYAVRSEDELQNVSQLSNVVATTIPR